MKISIIDNNNVLKPQTLDQVPKGRWYKNAIDYTGSWRDTLYYPLTNGYLTISPNDKTDPISFHPWKDCWGYSEVIPAEGGIEILF